MPPGTFDALQLEVRRRARAISIGLNNACWRNHLNKRVGDGICAGLLRLIDQLHAVVDVLREPRAIEAERCSGLLIRHGCVRGNAAARADNVELVCAEIAAHNGRDAAAGGADNSAAVVCAAAHAELTAYSGGGAVVERQRQAELLRLEHDIALRLLRLYAASGPGAYHTSP